MIDDNILNAALAPDQDAPDQDLSRGVEFPAKTPR